MERTTEQRPCRHILGVCFRFGTMLARCSETPAERRPKDGRQHRELTWSWCPRVHCGVIPAEKDGQKRRLVSAGARATSTQGEWKVRQPQPRKAGSSKAVSAHVSRAATRVWRAQGGCAWDSTSHAAGTCSLFCWGTERKAPSQGVTPAEGQSVDKMQRTCRGRAVHAWRRQRPRPAPVTCTCCCAGSCAGSNRRTSS